MGPACPNRKHMGLSCPTQKHMGPFCPAQKRMDLPACQVQKHKDLAFGPDQNYTLARVCQAQMRRDPAYLQRVGWCPRGDAMLPRLFLALRASFLPILGQICSFYQCQMSIIL